MSYVLPIGPNGSVLPDELWRCVLTQAATLDDAQRWADAFERPITAGDYRALLRVAAPDMLRVMPKPKASPSACAPRHPLGDIIIDYSPLLGPLYEDRPYARAKPQEFELLFRATAAMSAFAQDSSVTRELLRFSHEAWSCCFADEAEDESAYRSRCSSTVMFEALAHNATHATLWLGRDAKLAPFYRGLPALRCLYLRDIDAPLDLRPLQALEGLKEVVLGTETPYALRIWFRNAIRRLCPHVEIKQLRLAGCLPLMPVRLGSDAWFERVAQPCAGTVWHGPNTKQPSPPCCSPDAVSSEADETHRVRVAALQALLHDIDALHERTP